MKKIFLAILIILLGSGFKNSTINTNVYVVSEGMVVFKSEAPLEFITASSNKLIGAIDITANTFAFLIPVNTFDGFNSELQREHFNENYMESSKYPNATFSEKILGINWLQDGVYEMTSEGKFTIHGIEKERIIKGTVIIKNNKITINSKFNVLLKDHNINIPTVVYQKISESIDVNVSGTLIPREAKVNSTNSSNSTDSTKK